MSKEPLAHNLSIYVANRPGALARIAQTFSRRGFNIESLVVSAGVTGDFSRKIVFGNDLLCRTCCGKRRLFFVYFPDGFFFPGDFY